MEGPLIGPLIWGTARGWRGRHEPGRLSGRSPDVAHTRNFYTCTYTDRALKARAQRRIHVGAAVGHCAVAAAIHSSLPESVAAQISTHIIRAMEMPVRLDGAIGGWNEQATRRRDRPGDWASDGAAHVRRRITGPPLCPRQHVHTEGPSMKARITQGIGTHRA